MAIAARSLTFACAVTLAVFALLGFPAPASAFPPKADDQSFPLAEGLDPLRAYSLAFAPDGELWFAGSGNEVNRSGSSLTYGKSIGVVGHVSADGAVVEIPVGHSRKSIPSSITQGPDGAMWFTMSAADTVGRVAMDGTLTGFPLPPGTRPGAIVTGPDGDLWFTERGVGGIGRMTPTGELTEFPFGRDSGPSGIAVGPDGNLWFTLTHSDRIGRLTPTGARQVIELPKKAEPGAITATAAGLWFSELPRDSSRHHLASRVGFLTTGGKLRQVTLPARTAVTALSAALDGTVWYLTARAPAAIGSISPSGERGRLVCVVSTECQAPPVAIAVAPNGTPWFSTGEPECRLCGGGAGLALPFYPGYVGYLPVG